MELYLEEKNKYNKYSVLDGELAVPCSLKSAICRIEVRRKGFADLNYLLQVVLNLLALRNRYFSEIRQVWKEAAVGSMALCRKILRGSWL